MNRQEKQTYYIVHKQVKLRDDGVLRKGDLLESKDEGKTIFEVMLNKEVKLSKEDVEYTKVHGKITEDEYLALIAISSPEKRFKVFGERSNITVGTKALVGTAVEVKIKDKGFVPGTMMWKGTFDGCEYKKDKPGLHFGIKLERPSGDTNGVLLINGEMEGFICTKNCGIYVNIGKLKFASTSVDSACFADTWSTGDLYRNVSNWSRNSQQDNQPHYDTLYNAGLDLNRQVYSTIYENKDVTPERDLPDGPQYEYIPSVTSAVTAETLPAENCFIEEQRVYIMLKGECVSGKIKWMGKIQESDEIVYAGIKLKQPLGNCNGTWENNQTRHFNCDENKGIYLPRECLSREGFLETENLKRQLEVAKEENQAMISKSKHEELERQLSGQLERTKMDLEVQANLVKHLKKSNNKFWPRKGCIRFRRCCCSTLEE